VIGLRKQGVFVCAVWAKQVRTQLRPRLTSLTEFVIAISTLSRWLPERLKDYMLTTPTTT
jgi:hypothetical protein